MAQLPSPRQFLGYEPGDKFTPHYKIVGYFEALAKAAPDRMQLQQYGLTNEGRPLLLATISTAANMARIESIRQNNLQLAGLANGDGKIDGTAIVWLSYNVHGNEASSSEAAMKTIYYLLTDAKAQEWLRNTVVLIDPCLNPDGRDRYVNWYNSVAGDRVNPDPVAREHAEPWPGGRSNHYNFDLNRDWAWQTQVETQQRIPQYNRWMPHVHVDFHEQGFNEPYYFAPAAEPYHEIITPWQRNFQVTIGRNHARYFDANNWLYFTKERFDLLYPSYGDTWPTYNGAIGMTYEQGGIRAGLGILNDDADTLTLRDRVDHHFTTGVSTVEVASQHAAELQKNFQQFFYTARTQGVGEYKTFVVKAKGNEGKLFRLQQILRGNGIEFGEGVGANLRGFSYQTGKEEAVTIEKGDLLISTVQPRGHLVKVLFEPNSKISDSATYDITAWSLPYAHGLQAFALREKLTVNKAQPAIAIMPQVPEMKYGYLVRWKTMHEASFLAGCLQHGIKVRVAEKPFQYRGQNFDAGTLILLKTSNKGIADLEAKIRQLAEDNRVTLQAVETGFMDKGADFGSPDVKIIHAPRVVVATGDGTSSLSAGQVWHFFDRELKYPATLVNVRDLGTLPWHRFDVLVLPDGFDFGNLLGKESALRTWVQQGGKVIAMEGAVSALARAEWGLTVKKAENEKAGPYDALQAFGTREQESLKQNNPGSIYKVEIDNSHPLGFGYGKQYFTLKTDDIAYEFLRDGWNVGVIKKDFQVAGFTGSKVKERLKDGVLFGELPLGRGSVVFLADDVLFRSFWENGKLMMANALFMVNQRGYRF